MSSHLVSAIWSGGTRRADRRRACRRARCTGSSRGRSTRGGCTRSCRSPYGISGRFTSRVRTRWFSVSTTQRLVVRVERAREAGWAAEIKAIAFDRRGVCASTCAARAGCTVGAARTTSIGVTYGSSGAAATIVTCNLVRRACSRILTGDESRLDNGPRALHERRWDTNSTSLANPSGRDDERNERNQLHYF